MFATDEPFASGFAYELLRIEFRKLILDCKEETSMNTHSRFPVLLLIAAWAPLPMAADSIDISDLKLSALSIVQSPLPDLVANDLATGPRGSTAVAQTLLHANGQTFPNVPTSQNAAFSSAVSTASGAFGVGVNGFFLQNSLPVNRLVAGGTTGGTITNNSAAIISADVNFFVPAPTLQVFGVGDFDPKSDRDAHAQAEITLITFLNHPDGSSDFRLLLDYGLVLFRIPLTGALVGLALDPEDAGKVTRFDEPDGSFGFRLPDLNVPALSLGNIGVGDTLQFTYTYQASMSTGFGETGVLAAIGDPFNLSLNGGHFDVQVRDAMPPSAVPEPRALAAIGLGLLMLGQLGRRRRQTKS